jgi:hypothetical protein
MKTISPLSLATMWIASSQAFVVTIWTEPNCGGAAASRNVYDNTCAPTGGFQSFQITTYGSDSQQLAAYSTNDCVIPFTYQVCADGGSDGSPALGDCINTNGGSNAIGSTSSGFNCHP